MKEVDKEELEQMKITNANRATNFKEDVVSTMKLLSTLEEDGELEFETEKRTVNVFKHKGFFYLSEIPKVITVTWDWAELTAYTAERICDLAVYLIEAKY
jgi:hypothetical protein